MRQRGLSSATETATRRGRARVLVVDDDALMRSFLEQALARMELHVQTEASAESALRSAGEYAPHLALLDVRLGGMDGITLLGRLAEVAPECTFVVMTAHGSIETALAAMKAGAFDYLLKPFSVETLEVVAQKALGFSRLRRENRRLRARLRRHPPQPLIVGRSGPMVRLRDLMRTVARSPATVLIEGASGTGKELVAQALHAWGPRASGPLVKVNCAALPAGLMESELFGHERGAFTGATGMLRGKFELADGGSLLLDEISEMEPALQPKLLRSLQEREFYRVGGTQPLRVDVRIIATTNANLAERVRAGRFREDLYYRLRVIPIRIPPLRERRADIPLLAKHFLELAAEENGKQIDAISREVFDVLMEHDWPGNVRELENVIQRAVVICPDAQLEPEHLLWDSGPEISIGGSAGRDAPVGADPLQQLRSDLPLREVERLWILQALEQEGGNKSRAARRLGISVRTIRNKLNAYGLTPATVAR